MHADPYEAPRARLGVDEEDSLRSGDAVREREVLLGREAALRTAGWLLMPLAALVFILAFAFFGFGLEYKDGDFNAKAAAMDAGLLFAGTVGLFVGFGLAELKPWVKLLIAVSGIPVLLVTAPFLPFTGYCTWLALSAKGRQTLSREHVRRRALTPGLSARSHPGEALVVVGILVLNLVAAVWLLMAVVES
jgi:hypothetical protein